MTVTTHTGTTKRINKETRVDLLSDLIDLHRLPGESLASFRDRLIDNYINKGSSTYGGLVNAINRELDLDAQTTGILIDVNRDINGYPINANAGLEITPKYLTLYSNHDSGTVLGQYNLLDRFDSYFISDLITNINSTSLFSVVLFNITDYYRKSSHLEQISSKKLALRQPLQSGTRLQRLTVPKDNNFVTGKLVFEPDMGIETEVSVAPTSTNEFKVDRNNKIFWIYRPIDGRVTYWYQQFPLLIRYSPISIQTFKDNEYIDIITEQVTDGDGGTVDGIPTVDGADQINELLAVVPMSWGE